MRCKGMNVFFSGLNKILQRNLFYGQCRKDKPKRNNVSLIEFPMYNIKNPEEIIPRVLSMYLLQLIPENIFQCQFSNITVLLHTFKIES